MRGVFVEVWPETWRRIWAPLLATAHDHPDLICELYREFAGTVPKPRALRCAPSQQELADIVNNPQLSRAAFKKTTAADLAGEQAVVKFLEAVPGVLEDFDDPKLTSGYAALLGEFIQKFSLRYDLRSPFKLCPTLPGLFASLIRDLRSLANTDTHLAPLLTEFEDSVSGLRANSSSGHIKTCIQKQINLLEAIGRTGPGVTTGTTLGKICNEISSWPHDTVKDAIKNLYTFTCDYPGIRHGGTQDKARRDVDMRDMVAMGILLAGFTPYLSDKINADRVYWGA